MKKTSVVLILGIGIGWGFAVFLFKENPIVRVGQVDPILVPPKSWPLSDAPTQAPLKKELESTQSVSGKGEALPSEPFLANNKSPQDDEVVDTGESKQLLNLEVSEWQVGEMEDQLQELQRDVTLYRDTGGWSVRFYRPSNLIAAIGVKDQDLIRFSHLQELKRDPEKADLISRLEAVFSQLER